MSELSETTKWLHSAAAKHLPRGSGVTGYQVQYVMPVDNPVNNVRKRRVKNVIIFDVPVNHPLAHSLGFSDLLLAVEAAEKLVSIHSP